MKMANNTYFSIIPFFAKPTQMLQNKTIPPVAFFITWNVQCLNISLHTRKKERKRKKEQRDSVHENIPNTTMIGILLMNSFTGGNKLRDSAKASFCQLEMPG